jgi:hypothetical protein
MTARLKNSPASCGNSLFADAEFYGPAETTASTDGGASALSEAGTFDGGSGRGGSPAQALQHQPGEHGRGVLVGNRRAASAVQVVVHRVKIRHADEGAHDRVGVTLGEGPFALPPPDVLTQELEEGAEVSLAEE